jgi:hypothetical protein
MGRKTEQGQVLIELLLVVGVLFAVFYMIFQLSSTVIVEQSQQRFPKTMSGNPRK